MIGRAEQGIGTGAVANEQDRQAAASRTSDAARAES